MAKSKTPRPRQKYKPNDRVRRATISEWHVPVKGDENVGRTVPKKIEGKRKPRTRLEIQQTKMQWSTPIYLEMLRYYASDGLPKDVIAQKMNLTRAQLAGLLNQNEDIRAAFQWGVDHMVSRVESALLKSALGLTLTEKRKMVIYDRDGEIKETREEELIKEIPPNVDAIRCFLFSRAKDRYNRADTEDHEDRTINITIKKADGSIKVHDVIPIEPVKQQSLLNYEED